MLKLDKDQILLSRFSLIQPLGEGGMGQVWLVRDLELQINIAIKALHPRLSAIPGRIERPDPSPYRSRFRFSS
jgi:serine/threonine protein kinase